MKNVKGYFAILFLTASFFAYTQASNSSNSTELFPEKTDRLFNAIAQSNNIIIGQNITYNRYYNSRFNYSVAYPSSLLIPQGESQNGDGQKFLSKDKSITLLVYGSHNALNQQLAELYRTQSRSATREHPTRVVTYKTHGNDWFVVSGYENGKVFYNKTILRNGDFKVLEIQYKKSLQPKFDSIAAEISKSFKG
ncbi:MAG TPA: hypothetical protein V6C91_18365 [Coleofasciculaceae cyanobacterium]